LKSFYTSVVLANSSIDTKFTTHVFSGVFALPGPIFHEKFW